MIYINHIAFGALTLLYFLLFQQGIFTYEEAKSCFYTTSILSIFNVIGLTIWQNYIYEKSIKNQIGFSMLFTLVFFLLFTVQYMNSSQEGKTFTLLLLLNFIAFKICLLLGILKT